MSTKTQSDLITQVLENCGVLAAGQTAELEDIARVQKIVPAVVEFLRVTETYYLGNVDAIELAAFMPFSHVCAWECRSTFGITGDQLAQLNEAKNSAMVALKVISRGKPTYQPLKNEYI